MSECDVNTSSDLAPYLTPLTFNEDVRSLCDQISDNIIMGNDKRYMIYSELKSSDLSSDIELREAMGEFMVQWIHLEELVYIIRFITLILFTLPSAEPLLYEYIIPFFTAVKSFFMPFINV